MNNPSASPQPSPEGKKGLSLMKGLKCRECGRIYDLAAIHVCDFCFGPLEVDYDYEAIGKWKADLTPISGKNSRKVNTTLSINSVI